MGLLNSTFMFKCAHRMRKSGDKTERIKIQTRRRDCSNCWGIRTVTCSPFTNYGLLNCEYKTAFHPTFLLYLQKFLHIEGKKLQTGKCDKCFQDFQVSLMFSGLDQIFFFSNLYITCFLLLILRPGWYI